MNRKYFLFTMLIIVMFLLVGAFFNTSEIKNTIIKNKINVVIYGEIVNKGKYTLKSGAKLSELIALAGGLTKQANQEGLDFSRKLQDEEIMIIPSKNVNAIGDEAKFCNINQASTEQLLAIPGLSRTVAKKIVQYREKNGRFTSTQQLKMVQDVDNVLYEAIKPYIYVSQE